MRVLIGDRFGKIINEVIADIGPVSWVLDGIGKTALTMATSDGKATANNLQIGNRVYAEMDKGLPPWGGVIDLPRVWSGGTITVTCYTVEHLLDYRVTEKNASFYGLPLGAILTRLLAREEEQDPLGIVPGSIWMGGHPHWPRYHYKSLWYVLDYSLSRMERCDFLFTPYIDNGYIKFRADFFQEAGADKSSSVALIEGRNTAAGLRLEEQGAVVNTHTAVSEGSTWGPERITVTARDSDSVATYGLRETGKVYAGVSMPATLEMHGRSVVNTNSNPRRIFSLEVTNNTPGTFADYGLGDTVACVLPSFGFGGFDGKVRILGREYNPATGVCKLVVEEPHAIEPWIYTEDEQETEE